VASIRYNRRNSFSIPYAGGELVLFPGVNLNVKDELWAKLKAHPVVSLMLQHDEIEEMIKAPVPTSDIAGVPVVDNAKMDGEPVPVLSVDDRSAAKTAPDKVEKPKA
jgi:hypothetical protein